MFLTGCGYHFQENLYLVIDVANDQSSLHVSGFIDGAYNYEYRLLPPISIKRMLSIIHQKKKRKTTFFTLLFSVCYLKRQIVREANVSSKRGNCQFIRLNL